MSRTKHDFVVEVRRCGDDYPLHKWKLSKFTDVETDEGKWFGFYDEDENERLLLSPDEFRQFKEVMG